MVRCNAVTRKGTHCKLQQKSCPYHRKQSKGGAPNISDFKSMMQEFNILPPQPTTVTNVPAPPTTTAAKRRSSTVKNVPAPPTSTAAKRRSSPKQAPVTKRAFQATFARLCKANKIEKLDLSQLELVDKDKVRYKFKKYTAKKNVLGQGSFGQVTLVTFDKTKSFVMKTSNDPQVQLQQAIMDRTHVRQKYLECGNGIADYRVIGDKIIMNAAVSDLNNLIGKLSVKEVMELYKQMNDTLECLYRKGIYYFDIKPENMLLMCSNTSSEIVFGDIGSMYGEDGYSTTYTPSDFYTGIIDKKAITPTVFKTLCRFILAIFAANMLVSDVKPPSWNQAFHEAVNYLKHDLNYNEQKKLYDNLVNGENTTKGITRSSAKKVIKDYLPDVKVIAESLIKQYAVDLEPLLLNLSNPIYKDEYSFLQSVLQSIESEGKK